MKSGYIKFRKWALHVLDRFTRKKGIRVTVNNFKLNVPGRYFRYFPGNYEKENFSFLSKRVKQAMTCLDIGAHIGIYSVYMAKQCGAKVFSFEPTPRSFNTLKKMIALNHCENSVTAIQAAVCERSGSRSFYLNHSDIPGSDETRIAEINSLVHVDFDQHIYKEKIEVAAFSVDDFSESNHLKIGFIKIDAEGSEPDILKGARKTILKDRPSGILGIHAFAYAHKEETLIEIWNIMQEYDMVLLFDNREITESQFLAVSKMDIFDLQFFPR